MLPFKYEFQCAPVYILFERLLLYCWEDVVNTPKNSVDTARLLQVSQLLESTSEQYDAKALSANLPALPKSQFSLISGDLVELASRLIILILQTPNVQAFKKLGEEKIWRRMGEKYRLIADSIATFASLYTTQQDLAERAWLFRFASNFEQCYWAARHRVYELFLLFQESSLPGAPRKEFVYSFDFARVFSADMQRFDPRWWASRPFSVGRWSLDWIKLALRNRGQSVQSLVSVVNSWSVSIDSFDSGVEFLHANANTVFAGIDGLDPKSNSLLATTTVLHSLGLNHIYGFIPDEERFQRFFISNHLQDTYSSLKRSICTITDQPFIIPEFNTESKRIYYRLRQRDESLLIFHSKYAGLSDAFKMLPSKLYTHGSINANLHLLTLPLLADLNEVLEERHLALIRRDGLVEQNYAAATLWELNKFVNVLSAYGLLGRLFSAHIISGVYRTMKVQCVESRQDLFVTMNPSPTCTQTVLVLINQYL
jgi:hypothetical protein